MSENLLNLAVVDYESALQLALQQKGSVLRSLVTEKTYVGKKGEVVEWMGAFGRPPVPTGRFAPKARQDVTLDRRWVFPNDREMNAQVDSFDKLRVNTQIEGDIVLNQAYSLGREIDFFINEAFWATAYTGENGTTTTAFDTSGQVVSVSVGATASSINYDKLLAAIQILRKNYIDMQNEQIYCAIGAEENTGLMKDIKYISKEYGSTPVVENGLLKSFLGVTFINFEGLTSGTDDAAGTSYQIPIWSKMGMALGMWDGIRAKISTRNDLSGDPWQATATMTAGATRLDEKRIVKIWCRR
jgi:hypothetical protein